MKCELCDQEAVTHVTDLEHGAPREHHFCQEHAQERLGDYLSRVLPRFSDRGLDPAQWPQWAALLFQNFAPSTVSKAELLKFSMDSLKQHDARSRYFGAAWLGFLGPDAKEAVPDLRCLLDDPEPLVREAAKEAIRKIEE